MQTYDKIDPELDLVLERTVDAAPNEIWKCWTEPKYLMKWFCPRPWHVVDCRIDLKPGGEFFTLMEGPGGQKFPNVGSFLEVVPERKLVWTSVLLPGFRPMSQPENGAGMPFSCIITLEPHGTSTKYSALALHQNAADRAAHEKMGFHEGWGKAFEQMVEVIKGVSA